MHDILHILILHIFQNCIDMCKHFDDCRTTKDKVLRLTHLEIHQSIKKLGEKTILKTKKN